MIDTREELINALTEAAELEHGLMLQYLFAAMSLKQSESEGVTQAQLELLEEWDESIRGVAMQEMGHLGTVCNLLAAIGGGTHFRRPEFPQPARYYDPNLEFSLEPLTLDTIERFIHFEKPEGVTPFMALVPEPVRYTSVGDLYGQIRDAFNTIEEAKLFIGPATAQDPTDWSTQVDVEPVANRQQASTAIDFIIEQGEGTPTGGGDSHFRRFQEIREQLLAEIAQSPGFVPARSVLSNPKTRRAAGEAGNAITHEHTREVAELFNTIYGTLLLILMQYYAFNQESAAQSTVLRSGSVALMRAAINPLGLLLTTLPAVTAGAQVAGPGFQFYSDLRIPFDRKSSWAIIHERLEEESAECNRLATTPATTAVPGAALKLLGAGQALKNLATSLVPHL